jgi:hypothetical protein
MHSTKGICVGTVRFFSGFLSQGSKDVHMGRLVSYTDTNLPDFGEQLDLGTEEEDCLRILQGQKPAGKIVAGSSVCLDS